MCMIHNDTHIIVTLLRTLNQNFKIRRPCGSRTAKVHLSLRPCGRAGRADLKRFKSENDFADVTCDTDADIAEDVAENSQFLYTDRIRTRQMSMLNRRSQYFEALMLT